MTRYFTPVNGGGIVRFTQGGTASGWYQLDMPGRLITALPGVTVPQGSTGVLIQAVTDVSFCMSPQVAEIGDTFALTLAAGASAFIPGYEALQQLCFLLPASGAQFVLQFHEGGIGPTPTIA